MSKGRALEAPLRGVSRLGSRVRLLVPSATVFFTGGCFAVLVLVAYRLVARSLGASLYTWTSILGVALTGLAVGHYLGGRIADRYHPRRAVAVLFGLSSAACIGLVVANNILTGGTWLWWFYWPSHVLLHVSLVLLVPSTLLGAICPVVAKMAVGSVTTNVGRTIGVVYAWAAAGGIVGTFLAGFFLIVAFENTAILWFLGAALLLVAVLYWISCWAMYLWGMVFIALATMGMADEPWAQEAGTAALLRERPDPNVVFEAETLYGHLAVRRTDRRPDTRVFVQGALPGEEKVIQDAVHLPAPYLKVFAELTRGLLGDRKSPALLVLGAGGYVFPRYAKAAWPDCRVDVVEVDPGVTLAAREAFGLDDEAALRTIPMDARCYLDQVRKTAAPERPAPKYDFIYEDAVHDGVVPFPLVTKECNDAIAGLLADDGVYLAHLVDIYPEGRLLGRVVNTISETFPHVYVVVGRSGSPAVRDVCIVIATRRTLDPQTLLDGSGKYAEFSSLDDTQIAALKKGCDGAVLTDEYAPVENLLAPVRETQATAILARKYFDQAREFQAQNHPEASVQAYREALQLDPSLAVEAHEQMGLICLGQGKLQMAAESFRQAIAAHDGSGAGRQVMGAVHRHLGLVLGRMDQLKEGKEQLRRAVDWFRIELQENPGNVVLWEQLGETSATLGDFKGASDAFEKAVALEPRNPSHYQKLARALERQHRYDDAVAVVRKHVQLVKEQGRRDLESQLAQYIDVLKYNKVKRGDK